MNSDLIVVTFTGQNKARQVRQSLDTMRDRRLLGLEGAALVTRDEAGRAAVHQRWELPTRPCRPRSCLAALFASALFGVTTEERMIALADAGLDEIFLKGVSRALDLNGSALLVYVPPDVLADTRLLLSSLRQFSGTVHHTNFPIILEKVVWEVVRSQST